jgi:hypothetical protein
LRPLVALIFLTSCASSRISPGPVAEFSAGKLLLHLHDNEETIDCVSDPALLLRTLRPKLEEQEEALKVYLQTKKPSPESCLLSCVCDDWLNVHSQLGKPVYQGQKLENLQDYARNQPLALCIKDYARLFCGSLLEKTLNQESEDFRAPNS